MMEECLTSNLNCSVLIAEGLNSDSTCLLEIVNSMEKEFALSKNEINFDIHDIANNSALENELNHIRCCADFEKEITAGLKKQFQRFRDLQTCNNELEKHIATNNAKLEQCMDDDGLVVFAHLRENYKKYFGIEIIPTGNSQFELKIRDKLTLPGRQNEDKTFSLLVPKNGSKKCNVNKIDERQWTAVTPNMLINLLY